MKIGWRGTASGLKRLVAVGIVFGSICVFSPDRLLALPLVGWVYPPSKPGEQQLSCSSATFQGSLITAEKREFTWRLECAYGISPLFVTATGTYLPLLHGAKERFEWTATVYGDYQGQTERTVGFERIAQFLDDPWLSPDTAGAPTSPIKGQWGYSYNDRHSGPDIWAFSATPFQTPELLGNDQRQAFLLQVPTAAPTPPPPCNPPGIQILEPENWKEYPSGKPPTASLYIACQFGTNDTISSFKVEIKGNVLDKNGSPAVFPVRLISVPMVASTKPFEVLSHGSLVLPLRDGHYSLRAKALYLSSSQNVLEPGTTTKETGWEGWVSFWIGPPSFSTEPGNKPAFKSANGIDLVIASVEPVASRGGERITEAGMRTAEKVFFKWTVKNQGNVRASATDLSVNCENRGQTGCPTGQIVGTFDVPALAPGVSADLWTEGFAIPSTPVNWILTGNVDAKKSVGETDETNNARTYEIKPPRETIVLAGARIVAGEPKGLQRVGQPMPLAARRTGGVNLVPDVAVNMVKTAPEAPRAGKPFSVHVEFKNNGRAASDRNQPYSVDCVATPPGVACPLREETRTVGQSIPGGAVITVELPVASTPAGSYQIKFSPVPAERDESKTLEFTVIEPLRPGAFKKPMALNPVKK